MKWDSRLFINLPIKVYFATITAAILSGFVYKAHSSYSDRNTNSPTQVEYVYNAQDRKLVFDISDEDGINDVEVRGRYVDNEGRPKYGRFEEKIELKEENRRVVSFAVPKDMTQGQISLNINDNKQSSERKSFDLSELVK